MIKILIIEDEIPARNKLKRFISELDPYTPIQIIGELDQVQTALEFLQNHEPDVIFSDIELLDGYSFDIYQQINVKCPIIFTTAYDQYWMKAFEENGIDYLLKPFSKERFDKAWAKFLWHRNAGNPEIASSQIDVLTRLVQQNFLQKTFKTRFTIQKNKSIYFLKTEDIAFFKVDDTVIFAHEREGKTHILNETSLSDVENQLDPTQFFRINRSELVQKSCIEGMERFNKNTLAIKIKGYPESLKTSQSQTAAFREWLLGK